MRQKTRIPADFPPFRNRGLRRARTGPVDGSGQRLAVFPAAAADSRPARSLYRMLPAGGGFALFAHNLLRLGAGSAPAFADRGRRFTTGTILPDLVKLFAGRRLLPAGPGVVG